MQTTPSTSDRRPRLRLTTIVLVVYLVLIQIVELAYAVNEMFPPAAFALLQPYAFLGLICWWLQKDSARTGFRWPLDAGMFVYIAGVLILPYYLIKTRGVRGLVDILLFVGTLIAAWILASMVALILSLGGEY